MLSADDQQLENVSPAPRHSLPKWPFLLGDAILVVTALAVWFSTGALSAAQLFFCLGAVGLGAVIFVSPYVLENIRGDSGDFSADESSESGHTGSLSAGESEWRRQARAAAEAVEHAARANAALEGSARRFDARFAPLVEVQQSLTAVVAELREAAAARASAAAGETLAIQREFERLRKEQAEKFKTAEEKITALNESLAILAGHLKSLSTRPAPSDNLAQTRSRAKEPSAVLIQQPATLPVEEPVLVSAGVAVMEASPGSAAPVPQSSVVAFEPSAAVTVQTPAMDKVEPPTLGSISPAVSSANQSPVVDSETGEEKSMLAKALARAQSSGQTPAVAGIIMARARRLRKSKFPMPGVVAAPAVTSESAVPAISEPVAEPANPTERESWQALTEGKFDAVTDDKKSEPDKTLDRTAPVKVEEPGTGHTNSAFRRSARAKAIALRGDEEEAARQDAPVVFTPGQSEVVATQPSGEPSQGELLAREAETIRKRRSSRSPVPACTLTARVLIGIGNKPFVRGTGPGLSSEKGVPMEFVEIGQWRWVAPGVVKEPVTLRILKNDEIPAEGDPIVLHPGQSLDVSPVFPN